MSKVKCFSYSKMGHCTIVYPNKNKKKQHNVDLVEVDEFTQKFDNEFYLNTYQYLTSADVEAISTKCDKELFLISLVLGYFYD